MENTKQRELIVRQNSKVEKIPEDESEEKLLLRKTETLDNESEDHRGEAFLKAPHIPGKNISFMRALSRTSDKDENAAELTLNGNLHIFMPNTDETCGGAIKYRNDQGEETDVEVELKSSKNRKSACGVLKSKCKWQIIVNVMFGLLIATAIIIGIKALLANSAKRQHERYLYCYSCQSVRDQIRYIKRVNNMCCTHDPVQLSTLPESSAQVSQKQSSVVTSSYNSTRILEFQAQFTKKWENIGGKDIIPWNPITNMEKSFATFEGGSNSEIRLMHEGSYVITLSLTTDTFIGESQMVRVMACLVFTFPDGVCREECRQITHTEKMVLPFQIFKFDTLRQGTVLHAFITSAKALNSHSTHNKLYIVLL